MELQKQTNTLPKPLQELSQSGLVTNLVNSNFLANHLKAPKTVQDAVKYGQPISVVAKVSGIEAICNQLEFDLIKAMSLLNLNLTIKEHQYPMIVRELVDTFPNESIQDFQLCFKNGVTGKYGKIYNVDLSVLGTWMGEYLEEKYQYLESNSSQPETEPLPGVDYEAFKKRKAAMESLEAQAKDQAFKAERERQMKEMGFGEFKHGYKPDPEKAKEILLREQWRRDTYDPIKQGPGISFEEWLTKQ